MLAESCASVSVILKLNKEFRFQLFFFTTLFSTVKYLGVKILDTVSVNLKKKGNTKYSRVYSLVPQIVKGESNDSNVTLQKSRTGRIEEWKKRRGKENSRENHDLLDSVLQIKTHRIKRI